MPYDNSQPIEIENIELLDVIAEGGMSRVYRARQVRLDRIVAVKVLSKAIISGDESIKRFQQEAKFTSELKHPNIIQIVSFGLCNDGQAYLVMEYLEGLSLAEDLKRNGRFPLKKFKNVFLPLLSALEHAHQAGVVHRDIKPGNIMICGNEAGQQTVKLVDFGIAKAMNGSDSQQLTQTGSLLGSPSHMSPEQCQGKPLDGRSDLYSLACVMYECLTGEPPFSGDSPLLVMQKHSTEPPPTLAELCRKIQIDKTWQERFFKLWQKIARQDHKQLRRLPRTLQSSSRTLRWTKSPLWAAWDLRIKGRPTKLFQSALY